MPYKALLLMTLCTATTISNAYADNPDKCFWYYQNSTDKLTFRMSLPTTQLLKSVKIGEVAGTFNAVIPGTSNYVTRCPMTASKIVWGYAYSGGVLENGYTDVYKTGLDGIGVRATITGWGNPTVPSTASYTNAPAYVHSITNTVRLDFIQTKQTISSGTANPNLTMNFIMNSWIAADIKMNTSIKFNVIPKFSGCTSLSKNTIAMGKVTLSNLGKTPSIPFDLNVLCVGAPAGTKLPVKIYFEGSSDGPGRLNLDSGGAQGVELSLSSDKGTALPFTKRDALSMAWINSQPGGELYRLPITAKYANKPTQTAKPGKANATLNYIFEYN